MNKDKHSQCTSCSKTGSFTFILKPPGPPISPSPSPHLQNPDTTSSPHFINCSVRTYYGHARSSAQNPSSPSLELYHPALSLMKPVQTPIAPPSHLYCASLHSGNFQESFHCGGQRFQFMPTQVTTGHVELCVRKDSEAQCRLRRKACCQNGELMVPSSSGFILFQSTYQNQT